MLRQTTVKSLSRKRLNRVAINLGIFKATDYESADLEEKFIRSRLFSDETMLYFLTLSELRDIAGKLGIDISGVHRRKIIHNILDNCESSSLARAGKSRATPQKRGRNRIQKDFDPVEKKPNDTGAAMSNQHNLEASPAHHRKSDPKSFSLNEEDGQPQTSLRLIVIDFETTGLSAYGGDRVRGGPSTLNSNTRFYKWIPALGLSCHG